MRSMNATALTLERLLTHPKGFGLTEATPVQRAICRVADGLPLGELVLDEDVRTAFGGNLEALPTHAPSELVVLGPIRGGKSLIAAAAGVRASQVCDVSKLGPGEVARVSIVSVSLDLSKVVFSHLAGNILAKPLLRALLVEDPTADSLLLRHPSGKAVEVKCVAGARAGSNLVARWCGTVIFDEAPRMTGAGDGVVNLDHARTAVVGRLLPGAQIISIGSPWAPSGPIYDLFQEHWSHPSERIVVVKATGPSMNPTWWTSKRCERLRATDPDAYETDVLANFASPEESLVPSAVLDACVREGPLELAPASGEYVAAMDPGVRSNAWPLVVLKTEKQSNGTRVYRVACAREWRGSRAKPLSPEVVLTEIAALCASYGIREVTTDQFSVDAIRDLARRVGLRIVEHTVTAASKVEAFERLATVCAQRILELPPHPVLRKDLLGLRKRVAQTGGFSIVLPKTGDGRHADYASALALAVGAAVKRAGRRITYDREIDDLLLGLDGNRKDSLSYEKQTSVGMIPW
jgi:hypothetical protein